MNINPLALFFLILNIIKVIVASDKNASYDNRKKTQLSNKEKNIYQNQIKIFNDDEDLLKERSKTISNMLQELQKSKRETYYELDNFLYKFSSNPEPTITKTKAYRSYEENKTSDFANVDEDSDISELENKHTKLKI